MPSLADPYSEYGHKARLRYLMDLLSMSEASEAYREGPQWAVAAVSKLRAEIAAERKKVKVMIERIERAHRS